jgi:aryl-alcohol dehydrogenase-like predicted oxidoreductase
MATLVDDGLVRGIGLSNYDQDDIARCHRQRPVDVIQDGLSIIQYLETRDLFAWCGKQGIAVTVYDPLAGGLLTDSSFEQARERWIGTPWEDSTVAPGLFAPENADRATEVVDGLRAIADEIGATVAQVALAWLLRQPGVTSAIPRSRKPERARSNAAAAAVELSQEAIRAIDDQLIPRWQDLEPTW